jgi:hypothetical protein
MICRYQGTADRTYALKKIHTPSAWCEEHKKSLLAWYEGERMAQCYFYSLAFKANVARMNVSLPCRKFLAFLSVIINKLQSSSFIEFEVLQTSLLSSDHPQWSSCVVQPMASGKGFTMVSLIRMAAVEVLEAFSHFSYEFSDNSLVMVDFQGKSSSSHVLCCPVS